MQKNMKQMVEKKRSHRNIPSCQMHIREQKQTGWVLLQTGLQSIHPERRLRNILERTRKLICFVLLFVLLTVKLN